MSTFRISRLARLFTASSALLLISGTAASQPVVEPCTGSCAGALAQARAATAPYHEESAALADGFVPDPICVHYIDPARAGDAVVDASSPEVLLYEPQPDGSRRLVAVEYFAPVFSDGTPWFGESAPPVVDNAPPVLFGRTFLGPMPGHNPAMPWHYELHVWAWSHNPSGTFAQWNPSLSCPA
jgi:hypothetical protein